MSTPLGSSQWMYSSGEEVTQQSLKFNDDESQYLSWTPAAAGNRKTWTWSGWVKRGNLGGTQMLFTSYDGANGTELRYISGGASGVADSFQLSSFAGGYYQKTLPVHRDPSAWGQLVVSVDTTQATASDRVKIYFNGVQLANDGTTNIPQNYDTHINNNIKHTIGNRAENNTLYFDGYLSDIHFIDGQALDASSFGETVDGYWKAKDYAGTYGTNGFHLTFEDDVVSEGFNAVTYRGTGVTNSVSGLGFSPDLVWIKGRNIAYNHRIYDTVRGVNKRLYSDLTNGEYTSTQSVMSFDADGFTLGTDAGENNGTTPGSFVAWAWDAGSGSPISITDGSITSTVKANPSYGFSIVTWTATTGTVGHGLGTAPELIIEKRRSSTSDWIVGTTAIDGSNDYLRLNTTVGKTDSASASPTATVFTPNTGSGDVVAYCFNSVAGYSSIGSYSGNGSTSGPTVTTGFAPAFVMVKRTDSTGSWFIVDNTRDPRSSPTKDLQPNSSGAETDNPAFYTFTSTGFQLKTTGTAVNASGGTYIYMAFADTREAAFWKDVSGQGNHWTPNNLDYRDSLIDSPANNFAVSNPLDAESFSFAEGNLKVISASTAWTTGRSSIAVSGGKWYWEVQINEQAGSDVRFMLGIEAVNIDLPEFVGYSDSSGYGYFYSGEIYYNNGATSGNAAYTLDDVIGIALDLDAGTLSFYKNGTLQPQSFSSVSGTFTPAMSLRRVSGTACAAVYNFGQDSTFAGTTTAGGNTDDNGIGDFAYAPPAGFLALCTANLPTPTIIDGSEHFNTVLYTGNSSTQSITGVGFQPDFVWTKGRSQVRNNVVYDSVRGVQKLIYTNTTGAEFVNTTCLTSFDSDGFSLDSNSQSNWSSSTYVAWNWKAGGTAVSNTAGSITSQVSANVDAGFSIVSYTGTGSAATVGHGLDSAPEMVIVKRRDSTGNWLVWSDYVAYNIGSTYVLFLDATNAASNFGTNFNGFTTSTTFPVSTNAAVNASGGSHIAYCFHSVDGFSKVGSYTGNGSTDGPFVYTGFRPAWVMFKNTTASDDQWTVVDNKRDIDNPTTHSLFPSGSNSEDNSIGNGFINVDFVSNGFKIRQITHMINASSENYIYLAFAENPFKYANAR